MTNYAIFLWILVSTYCYLSTIAQPQLPQLCAEITQFTGCTTLARQRVDGCSQNVTSVPNLDFYDCQCRELTSVESCYTYCPDSPEIQLQLPNEKANAEAWCNQAKNMRVAQSATTSMPSTTVSTATSTTNKPPPVITPSIPPSTLGKNGSTTTTMMTMTTTTHAPGAKSTLDLTSDSFRSSRVNGNWICCGIFLVMLKMLE